MMTRQLEQTKAYLLDTVDLQFADRKWEFVRQRTTALAVESVSTLVSEMNVAAISQGGIAGRDFCGRRLISFP